ncbi:hypothetical protein JCM9140_3153 [Halalkalibacter wakoensis JCM 9140]|uniref:NERD domain-containing protein n=1 Tax=Halalkalibacter wakoensis JCM 9140 TaxID=1236970 RepID=W4Q4N3_9BACI|nr:nuclease-related domain-containing protein [Halalkalibacter wakoensis]GAE27041.1 hypothetical protein JCM9140_3153 [Halalkalibacter wakoensis JCM 9140]
MLLKARSESKELLVMRSLHTRMNLSEKNKLRYLNLEKGYEGEVKFDSLVDPFHEDRYILNDLLLEVNHSYFQIDSLILSQGVIHLLDIKNFEGDFYFETDKLHSITTDREYKNPIYQLKRSTSLLRQLLKNLKCNDLVDATIVFINPEFTLYQAPINQPLIFPTQLNRFLKNLQKPSSKLTNHPKELAEKLLSLHQTENPFTFLPEYKYEQLQRGVYCKSCRSFALSIENSIFICKDCGSKEKIVLALLRTIDVI